MKRFTGTIARYLTFVSFVTLMAGSVAGEIQAREKGLGAVLKESLSKIKSDSINPAPLVDDSPIDPRGKKEDRKKQKESSEEDSKQRPTKKNLSR